MLQRLASVLPAVLLIVMACSGASAAAASRGLGISPTGLDFSPGMRASSLTMSNDTDETKVIQASVAVWKQVNGESTYEPARDVVVTPPLFRIPPKGQQLVRVGFPAGLPDGGSEGTYRIFLEEVPETQATDSRVRFVLRMIIPLFVSPAKPADQLEWQMSRQSDGHLRVSAANKGNRHVRIESFQLADAGGAVIAEQSGLSYILAGSELSWTLTPSRKVSGTDMLRLKASSDRGPITAELGSASD